MIGQAVEGSSRILRNGEEIRYLDRPQSDELYKIYQMEKTPASIGGE